MGISISMTWLGLSEAESRFGRMGGVATALMGRNLGSWTQAVFAQTQAYTPEDTGQTVGTGQVNQTAESAFGIEYTISYGPSITPGHGKDAGKDYSIWPYYRTDLHHAKGRDHWIEAAINEREGTFGNDLCDGLEAALAGA